MSTFKNIPTPGSEAWKDNVATTADLPLTNNVVGDKRQVLDTKTIYSWNGSGWTAIASPAAAIAITGLLGDVTATGPGAVNATLKTVNLNVGEFGDAATAVTFTVNAKGLVTGASETPIQIAESQVTNLVDDLAGKQAALGFTPENVANKAINLTSPDDIKYPTTQAVSTALAGKFNNPTGTAADYVAGDGSIIAFPSVGAADRLVTRGYNSTGAPIPKMSVVYFNGHQGSLPKMLLAQANNEVNSAFTYGITQSAIGNMNSGIIVEAGRLENLDTNIAGWNEGDILYLSPTVPGGITAVAPRAPDQLVFVGVLIRKHPTQGVIQVKVQNGYELDELHNVQILTTPADGAVLAYDSVSDLWKPSTVKLTKGTKTIFCIDNGDYATLQAAVNAASAGDTILVGAKSGGWGDVIIPDNLVGKKLSIIGLQAARCPFVRVGAITFSPTLETQLSENELYLQNLYIASSTSACITFGGNKGARIRIDGCFIDAGLAMNSVALNNTVATSSAYIYNSLIQATTGTTIVSSTPYVRIYRSAVENTGTILLSQTAGFLESNDVNWSGARAGEIISIANGANFICGKSLIVNTTTNGSGVLLGGATSVIANSNNSWQIATGTGYCVRGAGVHLYGPYLTANSVALAYNVKIQNTITQIPYTLTFTPSP